MSLANLQCVIRSLWGFPAGHIVRCSEELHPLIS